MQVFSSFALLFGLSVVLPLYDFFILEEQKMYLVNNKNIELIYTYSLASYGCFLGVFFWLLNVYLYANNSFLEYSGAKK